MSEGTIPFSLMHHVKKNFMSVIMATFMVGVTYATLEIKGSFRDNKIAELKEHEDRIQASLETVKINELNDQFQIANHNGIIAALQNDNKETQRNISDIKSQVGIISTKMDNIIDLLKNGKAK